MKKVLKLSEVDAREKGFRRLRVSLENLYKHLEFGSNVFLFRNQLVLMTILLSCRIFNVLVVVSHGHLALEVAC